MDFDEDELAGFSGGGMQQQCHVGIDKNSGQIEGWESIWALLKIEDDERNALMGSVGPGFVQKPRPTPDE